MAGTISWRQIIERLLGAAALLLVLNACTALKASPAKDAGFLPKPEVVAERRERAPFNGYWVFDPEQYDSIRAQYGQVYVAPVDTAIVEKHIIETKPDERARMRRMEEVREVARYFSEKLRMMLKEKGSGSLKVAEQPGPETLELDLALVEVVPTNPGFSIAGAAAGFLVPGGGLIRLVGQGSVAIEGYVKDGTNGEVYEQFKDRETDKSSAFSVKDYQQFAHIRETVDDWAAQIVELLTTPSSKKVDDSLPFSINPL